MKGRKEKEKEKKTILHLTAAAAVAAKQRKSNNKQVQRNFFKFKKIPEKDFRFSSLKKQKTKIKFVKN
jgi:hypothetical protein